MSLGPLYHWSPRSRLGGIKRLGLVPGKPNMHGSTYVNAVTGEEDEFLQPGVCFSTDPATAWRYSHAVWRSTGEFDLWQVWLEPTDEVHVLPMWGGRITEVRVHNRIPKRRLIHIGERTVHPRT